MVLSLVLLLWVVGGSASAAGGSLAEFPATPCQNVFGGLSAITAGPDGNLWFTDPTGGIGRLTPSGASTCFALGYLANPTGIVAGPDGNLWFKQGDDIGRITTAGTVTLFPIPTSSGFISLVVNPSDIAAGPDGNVWFVELGDNQIGRITPTGTITEFDLPTAGAHPSGIAAGSDGNLWFTESGADQIGRITPAGKVTEFALPTPGSDPAAITAGPDGNVWFTETAANQIGRITPAGAIAEFPVPTPDSGLAAITAGPDGNVWFTESHQVGRITPTGGIAESPVPSALGIILGPDGNLWIAEPTVGSDGGLLHNVIARMPATPLPAAISAPSISGVAEQGQTLTESHGAWTNSPSAYTYQWDRCATNVGFTIIPCSTIPGATSQTYTLTAADVGSGIRVRETAITSAGGISAPAASAFTAVVQASPPANTPAPGNTPAPVSGPVPVNTSPPSPSSPTGVEGALPELGFLSIRPRAFRAARHGPPITRSRMLGSAVRYELNVRASVRFSVQHTIAGRLVGGRCEPRVHGSRMGRRCYRHVEMGGSFNVTGRSGDGAFRFSGRLNGRRLTPGNYQLTAVPTAIAGHGSPQTATFTILQ